jgi:DNA-binding HxlR family transcriptional regulator
MKSYSHYCGLARALDVIGDRWTLLIVRELLVRGPSRYTDLQHGLPGIATNMLANRLREMEDAGLLRRRESPLPLAVTLFELTPRGEALEDAISALGRWAGPLMAEPRSDDELRTHWYALPIRLYFEDARPTAPPVTLAVDMKLSDTEPPLVVEIGGGTVRTRIGALEDADAVLEGAPAAVMDLLSGRIALAGARRRGVRFHGDEAILRRLRRRASDDPSAA